MSTYVPPNTQVENISYGFYTSEEVRSISVRQITSTDIFDRTTNRAVTGGLHDYKLGPETTDENCQYCGLSFFECNGHYGHVEFPMPVYNPLVFDLLFKIFKSFCFHCFMLYNVESLQTSLYLLGVKIEPKGEELDILGSKSLNELRKIVIRNLYVRPRQPCQSCSANSFIIRHYSKQQITIRPSMKNSKKPKAANAEPDEIEMWSAREADAKLDFSLMDIEMPDRIKKTDEVYLNLIDETRDELEKIKRKAKDIFITPKLCRNMFRLSWVNNSKALVALFPLLGDAMAKMKFATDILFMENMLITPVLCRWPRQLHGVFYEHTETSTLNKVIKHANSLKSVIKFTQMEANKEVSQEKHDETIQIANTYLQAAVNGILSEAGAILPAHLENRANRSPNMPGLKERLEKKEGLFRKHMMGKRVNFACRSVISPDPCLNVDEVGIPIYFATRLTFPEPVNEYNIEKLRECIRNGPYKHPGANSILYPSGQMINLSSDPEKRNRVALNLAPPIDEKTSTIVLRHLADGDLVIMNRQPTLHRPSMQGHKVKVINVVGAKTLRMHYSNCKAYNADFDGDEMNGHLVQSYLSQAELQVLASVPKNYAVPKDGSPLAGLIQDHVIAMVKLTMKSRFLTKDEYYDLAFNALCRLKLDHLKRGFKLLPPTLVYPERLWTGKQVVSTILINLVPPEQQSLSLFIQGKKSKTELWTGIRDGRKIEMPDTDLIIENSQLLCGMIEKAHIGAAPSGLVHFVYEAYGPEAAANLLTSISHVANQILKNISFTLGLKDILLSASSDKYRKKSFKKLSHVGLCAFADAFGLQAEELTATKVHQLYRKAHFSPPNDELFGNKLAALDAAVKERVKKVQDQVSDTVIPEGLYIPFPENNLHLMVNVGAKGGVVNAQQMSVCLGQIELEGRRVPLMLSGRSLPSFPPYDVRVRAGGMCTHRFLTSMPPQELYFHSMAGRDGLVDTAVKTSRSGYLQRSVIKHLEDLMIQFDDTVRDSSQNIISFKYGDDGLDVVNSSFFNKNGISFYLQNIRLFATRYAAANKANLANRIEMVNLQNSILKEIDSVALNRERTITEIIPVKKLFKQIRRYNSYMETFTKTNYNKDQTPEAPCECAEGLRFLLKIKSLVSHAPPGDPVGLIAAQSIGEPSTQMTLNTFHFAGRGEMNVTLGIPRLREIIMTNTINLKTPIMEVPIINSPEAKKAAEGLACKMYRLKLIEVVKMPLGIVVNYGTNTCQITFNLNEESSWTSKSTFKGANIVPYFNNIVFPALAKKLQLNVSDKGKTNQILSYVIRAATNKVKTEISEKNELENTQPRNCEEWNEEDGAEASRRRRMEKAGEEERDEGKLDSGQRRFISLEDDEDDAGEKEELIEIEKTRKRKLNPGAEEKVGEFDDDDDLNEGLEEDVRASPSKKPNKSSKGNKDKPDAGSDNENNLPEIEIDDGLISDDDQTIINDEELPPTTMKENTEISDGKSETSSKDSTSSKEGGAHKHVPDFIYEAHQKFVKDLHVRFSNYTYDRTSSSPKWLRLDILLYDPNLGRIQVDLKTIIHFILESCVVQSVSGINRVIIDKSKPDDWKFCVEGSNFQELINYSKIFNLNKLYMNNINMVRNFYGIEAARSVIIQEVSGVFGHYGITVNNRHLYLIADYMTKTGVVQGFNRHSMDYHPSPLQQASFETCLQFLKGMLQNDKKDPVVSPSSCIVVGRPVRSCGTNSVNIQHSLSLGNLDAVKI